MSDSPQHEQIISVARLLHERDFIACTEGNISVRLSGGQILATPTCTSKRVLTADHLVTVDMEGRPLNGQRRRVSTEIGMHLLIYRLRPDVNAIVHAHPPTATGFAAAGLALDQPILAEAVAMLGTVPLAPYGTPGTPELADALEPLVRDHVAILMANHGVVTYAADLDAAYRQMETVEQFARVALVARQLGRTQPLSQEQAARLRAAGAEYVKGGS